MWFAIMIGNFSFAVKEHLRNGVDIADLETTNEPNFVETMHSVKHVPNKVSSLLYERIIRLYKDNLLNGDQLLLLSAN